jgi:hypothetical protein
MPPLLSGMVRSRFARRWPVRNSSPLSQAGANLARADLSEADLRGAFANGHTVWPDGFNPVAAGVIFE